MIVEQHKVEGFEAFVEKIEKMDKSKTILVLFSGSKDPKTGDSWCSDCVVALPVVEAAMNKSKCEFVYLYVGVGPRDFWKDPKCVFRTDDRTRLKSVPTLLKWGTPQRLEEDQCAKKEMIELLLEDDDE